MHLNEKILLSSSKYAAALNSDLEQQNVAPETCIYLLKGQLVDAAIFNLNLRRVISMLIWKLHVERAGANIKAEMGRVLQQSVDSLEDILKKSSGMHQTWRERFEKLDYDISLLQQQLSTKTYEASSRNLASFIAPKPHIRKTIQRPSLMPPQRKALAEGSNSNPPSPKRAKSKTPMGRTDEDGVPQICVINEVDEESLFEVAKQPATSQDAGGKLVPPGFGGASGRSSFKPPTPSARAEQQVSKSEIEVLRRTCQEAQIELAWNRTLGDLLMTELNKTREQSETMRKQVVEIRESSEQLVQDESRNWQKIADSLKVSWDTIYTGVGELRQGTGKEAAEHF